MTNTDKTNQQFSLTQIAHCLAIIDQLKPSGLNRRQFAKTQDLTYGQIRSWQSQAPRWRAKLIDAAPIAPTLAVTIAPTLPPARHTPAQSTRFVQLKVADDCPAAHQPERPPASSSPAPVLPTIRIDCSQGARSVVLHWPGEAAVQCAQWLKAYLA